MSFSPAELEKHCQTIIESPRIKNKIVVICEGEIQKNQGRLSPQSYKNMEHMPDANFYKACVPRWWSQQRPQFFNCGDRKDVIDTYFTLLNLHTQDSSRSYLHPDKLFAIIDLDLQIQNFDGYIFADTEEIFHNLYNKFKINDKNAAAHRIWVTGLIHKEAYFLIPELQSLFNNFPTSPLYKKSSLLLNDIYVDMADATISDIDLRNNLRRAFDRIRCCPELDCSDIEELQSLWKHKFENSKDEAEKNELVLALLTIKKAKSYWNQVQPSPDWTRPAEIFREQLLLEIGRFYSEESSDPKYHIPFFLKTLYEFV
ncbi:hypothetical protein H6F78_09415 [Coleofasciculus sp. FACHB-64]|uniref:hypothetical protein n=1 Tax=Cyanophyceae TaxID=3028117 RepID=UPI0016841C33|nr:hypothetical protein [Coleofasciculus sp. FACHB-64]MBD2045813.1 hypothetical protein [Coleofasciculus sp. FACHB-64]